MSDDDNSPVGFLGRLRSAKLLAWLLIIGLIGVTVSGATVLLVLLNG
jgi:hypothetical protein